MLQRIFSFLILLTVSTAVLSQDSSHKKAPALGLNFFFNDFKSAAAIRANPLGSAIRDKKLGKIADMTPGLAISYVNGLTTHFDFAASLGGSFLEYPTATGNKPGGESLLLEGDASVRAKMLSDNYWVVPFVSAGVGVSKFRGYYGATLPVGAGIQVNFLNKAYLIISSQYRVKITDNTNYHFIHSIGFLGNLKGL